MTKSLNWIFIACLMSGVTAERVHVKIDFMNGSEDLKKLPRFWTNTGFAPPEPVAKAGNFFDSDDVNLNLEIIGSLPNHGIKNIRIHWLLNLLSVSNYSSSLSSPQAHMQRQPLPVFDFTRLDKFLWKIIMEYRLQPTIEFMTTLKLRKINAIVWEDLSYQLVSRYIGQFGVKSVGKWKFETWNEPDLKGYNLLNFTETGYKDYITGIREGIRAAERQYSVENVIKLRGPAGLFKNEKKHPFCWGVLDDCNKNPQNCPIDIITFHRKGDGNNASEILNGSLDLLESFSQRFPNLETFKYSNSEADPIKKWSEPRDFQADTRYAATLVETVFEHWQAMYDGRMKNLESISHDNSFLNFHPNFFTQRTLLARFQMNNTIPKHVQFVQKPVFSALGLIANLGSRAGKVHARKNESLSYIISTSNKSNSSFYSCILLWSHVNLKSFSNKSKVFEIEIRNVTQNHSSDDEIVYFVEGIDNKRTNPFAVFTKNKSPNFPDFKLFEEMRQAQNPMILSQPAKISDGKIILKMILMPPFVVSIRICSRNSTLPKKIKNLRLRSVNTEEILIFWSDAFYRARCIKSYEIFFKYSTGKYIQIETMPISFMYFQLKHTIPGCFKVRSRDILNRVSQFSKQICYDGR